MGLGRVAVFVTYLCFLQWNQYEARAVDNEETFISMQMPIRYIVVNSSDSDDKDIIANNTPNMVLKTPSTNAFSKKTNVIIDLSGKTKQCEYASRGQMPQNETLNIEVYVNENSTNTTYDAGYLKTASNSTIEDGKGGITVIGISKSSTPNSKTSVTLRVYLVKSNTNTSDVPVITTNSTVSDNEGDEANADTGAEDSDYISDGNGGVANSGTPNNKSSDNSPTSASSGSGSPGDVSNDNDTCNCSAPIGSLSGDGASDDGSASSGTPNDGSSGKPASDGSSGGGSSGDGSNGNKSSNEGSPIGFLSGGGSSDNGSTNSVSSDNGAPSDNSSKGGNGSTSGSKRNESSDGSSPKEGSSGTKPSNGGDAAINDDGELAAGAGADAVATTNNNGSPAARAGAVGAAVANGASLAGAGPGTGSAPANNINGSSAAGAGAGGAAAANDNGSTAAGAGAGAASETDKGN